MKRIEFEACLVEKRQLNDCNVLLTLKGDEISQTAVPGQFVNLSCSLFLRRPFGICSVDPQSGTFTVGIRTVGKGSQELSRLTPGAVVSVLGPLGQGFSLEGVEKLITVGGGTGIFPLYFLQSKAQELGIPTIAINGFRSQKESFFLSEFNDVSSACVLTSDEGDLGLKGTVLAALEALTPESYANATLCTVGPTIMMKKTAEWAAQMGLPCYVSLEERMACGVGICLVCVCKTKALTEQQPFHHVRCCKEGPVFAASEVVW